MKLTSLLTLMMTASALAAHGADHKHPSDPCPEGSRTVEVTERTSRTFEGGGKAGADRGIGRGELGVRGSHTKDTSTKEKVCRDFPKSDKK